MVLVAPPQGSGRVGLRRRSDADEWDVQNNHFSFPFMSQLPWKRLHVLQCSRLDVVHLAIRPDPLARSGPFRGPKNLIIHLFSTIKVDGETLTAGRSPPDVFRLQRSKPGSELPELYRLQKSPGASSNWVVVAMVSSLVWYLD